MVSLAQRFQPVGFPEAYRPEAQPLAPRVALSFLFKSTEFLKYAIWLWHKSCLRMIYAIAILGKIARSFNPLEADKYFFPLQADQL